MVLLSSFFTSCLQTSETARSPHPASVHSTSPWHCTPCPPMDPSWMIVLFPYVVELLRDNVVTVLGAAVVRTLMQIVGGHCLFQRSNTCILNLFLANESDCDRAVECLHLSQVHYPNRQTPCYGILKWAKHSLPMASLRVQTITDKNRKKSTLRAIYTFWVRKRPTTSLLAI